MIEFYAYDLLTGKITKTGIILPGFSPDVSRKNKIVFGKQTDSKHYHNLETDSLELRPILNINDITIIVEQEYNPLNIPAGTIVNVDDEDVGIVDNTGLILVFPVAKTYKLQLKPPFPYFEKTITIEVITE